LTGTLFLALYRNLYMRRMQHSMRLARIIRAEMRTTSFPADKRHRKRHENHKKRHFTTGVAPDAKLSLRYNRALRRFVTSLRAQYKYG
jgi:hypothetical protein